MLLIDTIFLVKYPNMPDSKDESIKQLEMLNNLFHLSNDPKEKNQILQLEREIKEYEYQNIQ